MARNVEAGDILECTDAKDTPLKNGKKYIVLLVVNVGHDFRGPTAGYVVRGYQHDQVFDWPFVWDRNRFKVTNRYLPNFYKVYNK